MTSHHVQPLLFTDVVHLQPLLSTTHHHLQHNSIHFDPIFIGRDRLSKQDCKLLLSRPTNDNGELRPSGRHPPNQRARPCCPGYRTKNLVLSVQFDTTHFELLAAYRTPLIHYLFTDSKHLCYGPSIRNWNRHLCPYWR